MNAHTQKFGGRKIIQNYPKLSKNNLKQCIQKRKSGSKFNDVFDLTTTLINSKLNQFIRSLIQQVVTL